MCNLVKLCTVKLADIGKHEVGSFQLGPISSANHFETSSSDQNVNEIISCFFMNELLDMSRQFFRSELVTLALRQELEVSIRMLDEKRQFE